MRYNKKNSWRISSYFFSFNMFTSTISDILSTNEKKLCRLICRAFNEPIIPLLFTACKRNSFNKESVKERVDQQRWEREYHRGGHNIIPMADILSFKGIKP